MLLNKHNQLGLSGAVLESSFLDENPRNDGIVPLLSGSLEGYDVEKRILCPDYDHYYMQVGSKKKLDSGMTLFESLADDLWWMCLTP